MHINTELAENDSVTGFSFEVEEDTLTVMLDSVESIVPLEDELPGYELEDACGAERMDSDVPEGTEAIAFYKEV